MAKYFFNISGTRSKATHRKYRELNSWNIY